MDMKCWSAEQTWEKQVNGGSLEVLANVTLKAGWGKKKCKPSNSKMFLASHKKGWVDVNIFLINRKVTFWKTKASFYFSCFNTIRRNSNFTSNPLSKSTLYSCFPLQIWLLLIHLFLSPISASCQLQEKFTNPCFSRAVTFVYACFQSLWQKNKNCFGKIRFLLGPGAQSREGSHLMFCYFLFKISQLPTLGNCRTNDLVSSINNCKRRERIKRQR